MPISGDRYEFTQSNVNGSPDAPGVYELFDGYVTTYIGKATVSIRSRLQSHYRGDDGRCTKLSTHYKREVTATPAARERQLLNEYVAAHGRLPRCNEVMP